MANSGLAGEVNHKFSSQITYSNKNVDHGKGLLCDKPFLERALWFLESYGVTSKYLSVEDNNGQKIQMDISPESKTSPKSSKYEDLEDAEKIK